MPVRPGREGGPVVSPVHLEGTLAQLFLLASLLFGLLYSPHARADTPMPARPSVCDGASMITAANLDTKAQELNKSISELKLRLPTASDPAEIAKLTRQLEDLQKELLDLIFARECVRTDYSIQILRGPGDTAPPWVEITAFFATNRAATGSTATDKYFGAERQQLLQFGKAVVSIPTNRKPGTLDLPSLWKFELTADPNKHFIFKEIIPLQADAAQTEMSKIVAASNKKSLLIYSYTGSTSPFPTLPCEPPSLLTTSPFQERLRSSAGRRSARHAATGETKRSFSSRRRHSTSFWTKSQILELLKSTLSLTAWGIDSSRPS